MKFFVPYAADDAHAEQIWSDSRADLFDLGLPTTKRRIWALSFDVHNPACLLHIGREVPDEYGPAMLIFEASDIDVYYVCTPYNGILGGEPFVLGLSERGRAIDFDEVVEGNA
ncbi:MAG TPA: hypothetical protein VK403_02500 [Allosphingosinicella sp.]|nr:hypothetical protein [Allosphingosinicella sp.]